jgi:hypothetical protein
MHAPICFVAELHEPFAMRIDKRELEYIEMTEDQLRANEGELKKMRGRRVIGTISTRNHQSLHESAWGYRLAVDPSYSFVQTARPLILGAMKHAFANGMLSFETATAECHEDSRELFLKIG